MATGGVQKVQLKNLVPEYNNVLIVGIIIAKQRPRKFVDYRNGDAPRDRSVWNFTLRDSPACYINVSCWGSKETIFILYDKFHVGDVVDICHPQIEIRKINDYGEQFRPRVTSPYHLTLNENADVNITPHEGNWAAFSGLLHLPTKPIAGAITIADIHNQKEKLDGVDILAVVRTVGKVRNVITREGVEQQVRDVIVFDQTSPTLKITLWEPDLIIKAGMWKINNTILFLTDVHCEWSAFVRAMVATLTSRTVVTEEPVGLEAENLRKYARDSPLQPSSVIDQITAAVPNPMAIRNVMNIQQVLDKAEMIMNSTNLSAAEQQFTALLYAVVTQLDLDGFSRVISTRCSRCYLPVDFLSKQCVNNECPVGTGNEPNKPISNFDLSLMLSDQTGSLTNCHLSGRTAETVLNCSVENFLAMGDEEKSVLKWNFLMERCEIRIVVLCSGYRTPFISIVSCSVATPEDVANKLPHY